MAHVRLSGLGAVDLKSCDSFWTAPLCCYDWYRGMFPEKCPEYIAAIKAEFPEIPFPPAVGAPPLTSSGTAVPGAVETVIVEQDAAWKAQMQAFMEQLAAKQAEKKCGWSESMGDDGECHFPSTTVVILGAGAVLLMIYMKR